MRPRSIKARAIVLRVIVQQKAGRQAGGPGSAMTRPDRTVSGRFRTPPDKPRTSVPAARKTGLTGASWLGQAPAFAAGRILDAANPASARPPSIMAH